MKRPWFWAEKERLWLKKFHIISSQKAFKKTSTIKKTVRWENNNIFLFEKLSQMIFQLFVHKDPTKGPPLFLCDVVTVIVDKEYYFRKFWKLQKMMLL